MPTCPEWLIQQNLEYRDLSSQEIRKVGGLCLLAISEFMNYCSGDLSSNGGNPECTKVCQLEKKRLG